MYYIYGISGPSLLIESTDSMINHELCSINAQCHIIILCTFHSIIDLVFGFEQPSYTFSESVGVANLGVRLSPESRTLSIPLVFTFTTEDDSAICKRRKIDLLIILIQVCKVLL